MPSFNDQIKHQQAAAEIANEDPRLNLYWTPRHYAWLAKPSYERGHSDKAIAHAMRVLTGGDIPPREGEQTHRFSASSIGGQHGEGFACHRAALFNYAGWKKLPLRVDEIDNMNIGNACHLEYQMEGLDAGYIVSCETWDWERDFQTGGKDDGLLEDGSLLELKFVKGEKFLAVTQGKRQYGQAPGPVSDHVFQVKLLMRLKKIKYASLVYVNRENGQFREFRFRVDEFGEIETIIDDLNDWVHVNKLPAILPNCLEERGYQFTHCSYRDRCLNATTVFE